MTLPEEPNPHLDHNTSLQIYLNAYSAMPNLFPKTYDGSRFFLGPKLVGGMSTILGAYDIDSDVVRMHGPYWTLRIGRKHDNDLIIDAPIISGHHAVIERSKEGVTLEDLSSTNGTYLNGDRLPANEKIRLMPRAHIVIGSNMKGIYNPPWVYHTIDTFVTHLDKLGRIINANDTTHGKSA